MNQSDLIPSSTKPVFKLPPQYRLQNRDREILYTNSSGTCRYKFSGWQPGDKPSETFKRGDYVGCLHGITFALLLLTDPYLSHEAIEDDGILHEVIHVMHLGPNNVDEMDRLAQQLEELENKALAKYDELIAEQQRTGTQPTYDFRVKRPELKAAPEVQQEEVSGWERISLDSNDNSWLHPCKSVHQSVLPSTREEVEISAANYIEAGRSDDVR